MKLKTTIIDGMDLELAPVNFIANPVKRTAISSGVLGNVHFLWPSLEKLHMLTLTYEDLHQDQVQRILAALGPATLNNKTLQFIEGGDEYFIPGRVGLRMSGRQGVWTVTVDTVASLFSFN